MKVDNENCEFIEVGKEYPFNLTSFWSRPRMLGKINIAPSETPHVSCLSVDSITNICIDREHGINDVWETTDLRGLCYIKK